MSKAKANWLDPTTTAENEVLPGYVKWAWTSRAVSLGINAVLLMQITYFCTDMLGLDPLTVGTLFLASKLFDGVTDLIAGFLIDKTNTKWGKARPYELFIIAVWVLTIALYAAPNLSQTGLCVFVFIVYTLLNSVCATFLYSSDAVYLARSVRSEKNRISVMSFNGGVLMLLSIAVSIALPILIGTIGAERSGWIIIALIFGVPLMFIGLLRFFFVKEVVSTPAEGATVPQEKLDLGTGLKARAKNKYIFILAGMCLLAQLMTNMTATTTYYFKYIIGDVTQASLVSMSAMVTPFIIFLFPLISRKLGTVGVLRAGLALSIVGYLVRIIGGTGMITIIIGSLVSSVGTIPLTTMINIYLVDCMEYGQYKSGVRVEGIVGSVVAFCNKVGSGLASGLVGIVMGMAGYNGDLAVQSAAANAAIVGLFNWAPLIMTAVILGLALIYRIDKDLPALRAELANRK